MIPQANITAWRKFVPWSDDAQVEQDLILSRAEFEANLHGKESDDAFMSDIGPLLRPGIEYSPSIAIDRVRATIISLLPGEPWRGSV